MTPEQFTKWLGCMKANGLAKSDADCARMLGITANGLVNLKKRDSDKRTELAAKALYFAVSTIPAPWENE